MWGSFLGQTETVGLHTVTYISVYLYSICYICKITSRYFTEGPEPETLKQERAANKSIRFQVFFGTWLPALAKWNTIKSGSAFVDAASVAVTRPLKAVASKMNIWHRIILSDCRDLRTIEEECFHQMNTGHFTDQGAEEVQPFSVGQRRPPAGHGNLARGGIPSRLPFDHQHLTAGLILI